MKIDAKPFKTLEELVELLNQWGNNFLDKNPTIKNQVYEYIKKYNFQVCVNGFAPLLWKNLSDGITDTNPKFIENFQFKDLEQLFNFDKTLKTVTTDLLQEVEERLTSGVIYFTLKSIQSICDNNINFPFLLFDDYWSQIIAKSLFSNRLSKQSFVNENNEFMFENYYSFLTKYIEPFNIRNLFSKNLDIRKFYFYKVFKNRKQLKSFDNLGKYKKQNEINDKFISLKIYDLSNHTIQCTFNEFFKWCKQVIYIPEKFENDDGFIDNSTIDGMINVFAKAFIPMYKTFTQESFGDTIKFFSKLNENIQIDIIKEYFPTFYQKIITLVNDKENTTLILISTFISLITLFKNLRNRIAHLDIIYNFWYIYAPNFSNKKRNAAIEGTEFWIGNQESCTLINGLINSKNNNFVSNYFKQEYADKDFTYYLEKISSLKIKVYSKKKKDAISFTSNSNDCTTWPLPMFFLKDAINWLLVFTDNQKTFKDVFENCLLKNNVDNQEIRNRLHDYLFNKIIISLNKVDENNDD